MPFFPLISSPYSAPFFPVLCGPPPFSFQVKDEPPCSSQGEPLILGDCFLSVLVSFPRSLVNVCLSTNQPSSAFDPFQTRGAFLRLRCTASPRSGVYSERAAASFFSPADECLVKCRLSLGSQTCISSVGRTPPASCCDSIAPLALMRFLRRVSGRDYRCRGAFTFLPWIF